MLPRILKNFTAYVDGRGYFGRIESCKLPDLKIKTAEYRGGGMDAPIEHDMGMEKIDVEIMFAEHDPELIKLFGLFDSATQIVLRGALQRQGENVAVATEIRLQGGIKELTRDEWKPGEKGSMKLVANCNIYKETQDGETLVDIDLLNSVRVIGGVDQLAAQRDALGI